MSASKFIATYRNLLRSIHLTFKGAHHRRCISPRSDSFAGDRHAIHQSKSVIRDKISRLSVLNDTERRIQLQELDEVNDILRKNIVQAQLGSSNNYNLRFTPHTELGDNSTISQPPTLDNIKKSMK